MSCCDALDGWRVAWPRFPLAVPPPSVLRQRPRGASGVRRPHQCCMPVRPNSHSHRPASPSAG
ncbi:hypothetical protein E2C01_076560 [Portunus trituberculatus]|uniref:Uncharacterized protein n=1 Tax=Portunus trituberculatus TaxID=210409 RepID=A0A5B7IBX1_PORTR|nr:hypothetical protein [Portunus trituberculatus]